MRAFPFRADCPLPSVEALIGSLVSSCAVPEACAAFDAPFSPPDIPAGFDFGCWILRVHTSLNLHAREASFSAFVEYPSSSELDLCSPVFNFQFDAGGAVCVEPRVKVELTQRFKVPDTAATSKKEGELGCDLSFNLQVDYQHLCPQLEMTGSIFSIPPRSSMSSSGQSWWEAVQPYAVVKFVQRESLAGNACACDFEMSLFWPSLSASLKTETDVAHVGTEAVCQTKMVKTIDFFRFIQPSIHPDGFAEDARIELGFTTMPAWNVLSSIGAVPGLIATPCVPIGVYHCPIVIGFEEHDCLTGYWPQAVYSFDTVGFFWSQTINYEPYVFPFGFQPVRPACCQPFRVVTEVIEDADSPKTGCHGSLTLKTVELLVPQNIWDGPPYQSEWWRSNDQFINDISVGSNPNCSAQGASDCAYLATLKRTFITPFPDKLGHVGGLTIQASANFDPMSSSSGTCWFPALKFDHGLLVRSFLGSRKCQ